MGNSYFKGIKLIHFFTFNLKRFHRKNLKETNRMPVFSKQEVEDLKERLSKTEELVDTLQKELKEIKGILYKGSDVKVKLIDAQKRNFSCVSSNSETDGYFNEFNNKRKNIGESNDYLTVYTDGACENNGKLNAKAGIGVWFGPGHPWNISEPVNGRPTNNTAEIQACIRAVQTAQSNGVKKLLIKTDSQFVINSMTNWIKKWKQNNWRLSTGGDVKNKTDFAELDKLINQLDDVKWEYVAGHKGYEGNEEADKLARNGATLYKSK